MGFIKNYDSLNVTEERKLILDLIEAAFTSIQTDAVLSQQFLLRDHILQITNKTFPLQENQRIFLLGFGKGSAGICQKIEMTLGDKLTGGYVIDVVDPLPFQKIQYTKGTHPLPSQDNIDFTKRTLSHLKELTKNDYVLVVICGGGSVLFEQPFSVDLTTLTNIVHALLTSGANISEMNVIRKHLSRVKGGNLAKLLYPATVISLIFSDVPGNDLSVIASGPTTKDTTTLDDVKQILQKYTINSLVTIPENAFTNLPQDDTFFANVHNLLVVTNQTALKAMQNKAQELGYLAYIYSDKVQGDARLLGNDLLNKVQPGQLMLAGGESTIKVTGSGKGGRNQALALSCLQTIDNDTILAAFDSDGWDFYELAGAIVDAKTKEKTQEMHINPQTFLANDDSYGFFAKVGDGILTGKLESNVSDLYIVYKKGR